MQDDPFPAFMMALVIASIFGRAPFMLICLAMFGKRGTQRARYTMLALSVVIAIGVTGGLAYAYSVREIIDFLSEFDPVFAWGIGLSITCAESVVLLPLAIWRVWRTPNHTVITFWGMQYMHQGPDGTLTRLP